MCSDQQSMQSIDRRERPRARRFEALWCTSCLGCSWIPNPDTQLSMAVARGGGNFTASNLSNDQYMNAYADRSRPSTGIWISSSCCRETRTPPRRLMDTGCACALSGDCFANAEPGGSADFGFVGDTLQTVTSDEIEKPQPCQRR